MSSVYFENLLIAYCFSCLCPNGPLCPCSPLSLPISLYFSLQGLLLTLQLPPFPMLADQQAPVIHPPGPSSPLMRLRAHTAIYAQLSMWMPMTKLGLDLMLVQKTLTNWALSSAPLLFFICMYIYVCKQLHVMYACTHPHRYTYECESQKSGLDASITHYALMYIRRVWCWT